MAVRCRSVFSDLPAPGAPAPARARWHRPPGQGHVEQAQVFGEALLVGLGQGLLGAGEIGSTVRLPASPFRGTGGCRRRGGCK